MPFSRNPVNNYFGHLLTITLDKQVIVLIPGFALHPSMLKLLVRHARFVDGVVRVRTLASHQCVPRRVYWFSTVHREVFLRVLQFSQKTTFEFNLR